MHRRHDPARPLLTAAARHRAPAVILDDLLRRGDLDTAADLWDGNLDTLDQVTTLVRARPLQRARVPRNTRIRTGRARRREHRSTRRRTSSSSSSSGDPDPAGEPPGRHPTGAAR